MAGRPWRNHPVDPIYTVPPADHSPSFPPGRLSARSAGGVDRLSRHLGALQFIPTCGSPWPLLWLIGRAGCCTLALTIAIETPATTPISRLALMDILFGTTAVPITSRRALASRADPANYLRKSAPVPGLTRAPVPPIRSTSRRPNDGSKGRHRRWSRPRPHRVAPARVAWQRTVCQLPGARAISNARVRLRWPRALTPGRASKSGGTEGVLTQKIE